MVLRGLVCALAIMAATAQSAPPYDLLIVNGRLLDGTREEPLAATLAIRDGRIAAIGGPDRAPARTRIDARGMLVTPGFIDVHSHGAEGLLRDGLAQARPLLAQGITTIVANPDGGGPVDLDAQREGLTARGIGPNVALLIGHGSVRRAVMGTAARAPTGDELDRMCALVDRAMEAGAFGLSSGLFYTPGRYATTDEVIALARRVAPRRGVYTSHIRDESSYGQGFLASVDEVIRIAREAGVTGIVSHMKALGPDTWGQPSEAIRRIEAARGAGVRIAADQYPYDASSTSLDAALLPGWALDGDRETVRARLGDPGVRERLLRDMADNLRRRGGADAIQIAHHAPDRSLEGRTLAQVAAARGGGEAVADPRVTALDLMRAGPVSIVSFNMHEDDIAAIMRQPWTMTSSDGGLVAADEGVPHPRNYGAFPRKLARYVRDRRVVTLPAAVRSMTTLPADLFGLADRGRLVEGAVADVLVFDPETIQDEATYADPHRLASGMAWVIVNGVAVIERGRFTEARPGQVLRKP
jgi:N-acyl-D-amino-acid deacylase